MGEIVTLRGVVDSDLAVFFEQQADGVSSGMAGVAVRSEEDFEGHWERIRGDGSVYLRCMVLGGDVVGHLVSWEVQGRRFVGYWVGRGFWGRGIASMALGEFLGCVLERPLYARVSFENWGSIRVLEKNGFSMLPLDGEVPGVKDFVLLGVE